MCMHVHACDMSVSGNTCSLGLRPYLVTIAVVPTSLLPPHRGPGLTSALFVSIAAALVAHVWRVASRGLSLAGVSAAEPFGPQRTDPVAVEPTVTVLARAYFFEGP